MRDKNIKSYQDTAEIISNIQELIENCQNTDYTPTSKKLAASIMYEWAKDLRKSKNSQNIKLAAFLEGLVKFLI